MTNFPRPMGQRLIDLQPQKWPKVTKPNEAASRLWTPPTRPEQPKRPDSGRVGVGTENKAESIIKCNTLDHKKVGIRP